MLSLKQASQRAAAGMFFVTQPIKKKKKKNFSRQSHCKCQTTSEKFALHRFSKHVSNKPTRDNEGKPAGFMLTSTPSLYKNYCNAANICFTCQQ